MKKIIFIVAAIWIILISGSFYWNYTEAKKAQEEIAFQTARSFFDQIVITRKWNAQHGGVYVIVTDTTRPNPFLDTPLRDIEVSHNIRLTKINPAYMTRQISEVAAAQKGVQFHITSMIPIRPENKPTPQEVTALQAFQKGTKEIGHFVGTGKEGVFFYMAPLKTEKACLQCHAKQGYKEGDIRGGISVMLPFISRLPLMTLAVGHMGIGLIGVIGIIIFGNRLAKYNEILRKQSVIDALTGIPNRRNFSETILREIGRAQRQKHPLSLIMCDVDKFKDYNDTYGHDAGDECLKKVARAIEKTLSRPSDFCARYGGEEFVIVLPNTTQTGALHIAEMIRANVQNMGIVHERSEPLKIVTLSLGVATIDRGILLLDEDFVHYADKALYKAKEKGRNRVEAFNEFQ
jgi:diguanylate cyclase (GGDEF)-like protein